MKEGFSLLCPWLVIDSCSKIEDGLILTRTCLVGELSLYFPGLAMPGTLRERAATWLLCAVAQIWPLPLPSRLGLVCQVIVTGSRHLSFFCHLDSHPQCKPVSMTAFLFYSSGCFCANDPHHWAVNGSWSLCSREGHRWATKVNKCWLHVLCWVREKLFTIRAREALRLP